MKKQITRIFVALMLVALMAVGAVFAASANNSGAIQEPLTGKNENDTVFFAGTRIENDQQTKLWGSPYLSDILVNATAPLWPTYDEDGNKLSDGASIWIDFEYYYDAYVKAGTTLRLRSYKWDDAQGKSTNDGHVHIATIVNGEFTWNTPGNKTPSMNAADGFKLPSYGWHHIAIQISQSTVLDATSATNTRDTITVNAYLNGEPVATATASSYWFDHAWQLYESSAPEGAASESEIVYSGNSRDAFWTEKGASGNRLLAYIYGTDQFCTNDKRLVMIKNLALSYGSTPRRNLAPIKLLSDGITPLSPDTVIIPNENKGTTKTHNQTTYYEQYPTYDVVSWKNFYEVTGEEKSIALPSGASDGVTFGGWYADANYTTPLTSLTLPSDGSAAVAYSRTVSPSFAGLSYASGTVYEKNNTSSEQKGTFQLAEINLSPDSSKVAPLWIELDYYVDSAAPSSSTVQFRFTDPDAYTDGVASGRIASGKTWAYKKSVFEIKGNTLQMNPDFHTETPSTTLGGDGWHHVAVKYEQVASYESGTLTNTFIFTVYVDGEEALNAPVTKATFYTEHYYYLFKTSYDAENQRINYESNANLKMYYYGSGVFNSKEPAVWGLSDLYLTYGPAPVFSGTAPIRYHLNGGSLKTETVDGWSFHDPINRFFPLKADGSRITFASDDELKNFVDGSYAAYQYSVTDARNYYVMGSEYALPVPSKYGMDFVGWYDNPDFTGSPIVSIPADQVGKIELYARFEGRYEVVLMDGASVVTAGKFNFYLLPETSAYWVSADDGMIYEGGEEAELSVDSTFYALRISLLDGAAIRLSRDASGLRFFGAISSELIELLDDLGYRFSFGALVAPTDKITGEFTVQDLSSGDFVTMDASNIPLNRNGDESVFSASLIHILPKNYTRAFSAVAYLTIETENGVIRIYSDYSEEKNSRSVYEVAKAAYADTEYGYTAEELSIIRSFLDGVLVLSTEGGALGIVSEVVANGYATPYGVSYESGVLTVTKPAEQTLCTIVIDGKAYTRGWQVSPDGLSVQALISLPALSSEK